MINEHDITKKILETIRNKEHFGKFLIKEDTLTHAQAVGAPGAEVPDEAKVGPTEQPNKVETDYPSEFESDKKSFKEIVTPRVQFKSFNIYPDTNEVVFSGVLDNGIEWEFKKSNKWPYINAQNIEFDEINKDLINKISAYFQNWLDKWSKEDLNRY
jgi:hypothetical protein